MRYFAYALIFLVKLTAVSPAYAYDHKSDLTYGVFCRTQKAAEQIVNTYDRAGNAVSEVQTQLVYTGDCWPSGPKFGFIRKHGAVGCGKHGCFEAIGVSFYRKDGEIFWTFRQQHTVEMYQA